MAWLGLFVVFWRYGVNVYFHTPKHVASLTYGIFSLPSISSCRATTTCDFWVMIDPMANQFSRISSILKRFYERFNTVTVSLTPVDVSLVDNWRYGKIIFYIYKHFWDIWVWIWDLRKAFYYKYFLLHLCVSITYVKYLFVFI